ncbi:mitochondrial ribosomal protein MRP51 [Bombardia bombarda]|uniref:Mitochondrial ribosomal protein MRP51 n=1 Tax=Bombardia bombarda TaxID=252184 RepID=A0AA40C956_9PEZI|nr:mitochondrial ribosomal protein MRP51 [Bombardia bombarda]
MAPARGVSPGGALLRASRLFSVAAPIPPPPTKDFIPDSATLHFPTHQVITTLGSSRKRGDWGLKRPLPLKSTTKSSNAMLRVNQLDSIEHITDYTSATDVGVTLRKFQELHLPITVRDSALSDDRYERPSAYEKTPWRSAFEEDSDFTAVDSAKQASAKTRWKFKGPWLAGMTEGAFQSWLAKTVKPKRAEFRQHLKECLEAHMLDSAKSKAIDDGVELPTSVEVTEEQFIDYLRRLRNNREELYEMVGQFLDLAPLEPPKSVMDKIAPTAKQTHKLNLAMQSPYKKHGPPITHPSAGISYLRTSNYIDNHPIYGPQRVHKPVMARVVKPRPAQGMQVSAKLGVAGFIADSSFRDTATNSNSPTARALQGFDPDVEGGQKVWVHVDRANIDATGRVILDLHDTKMEDLLVTQELLGQAKVLGEKPKQPESKKLNAAEQLRSKYGYKSSRAMGSGDYGIAFRSIS